MPNWCSNAIAFYSKDKTVIEEMQKKFVEIYNGDGTEDADSGFMGDFLEAYFPQLKPIDCEVRGWVNGRPDEVCQIDDWFYFKIWVETAWGPKMRLWYDIATKCYKGVKIAYISEECGFGLFHKWDEDNLFFPDTHYIDACYPTKDGETECVEDRYSYGSAEDIMQYFDERLPFEYKHTDNLQELETELQEQLDKYEKEHDCGDDLYCQIGEFIDVHPAEYSLKS